MKSTRTAIWFFAAWAWSSAAQSESQVNQDTRIWLPSVAAIAGGAEPLAASIRPLPTPAPEHNDDKGSFDISGTIAGVTDYRFRGVSLSNGGPVPQGGITARYGPFSTSLWTSRIARTAGGSRQEVDLSLAATKSIAGFEVTGSGLLYLYPGDGNSRYAELALNASRSFGKLNTSAGFSWAPAQSSIGDVDNYYVNLGSSWENRLVTLSATAGHEWGAFAPGGKWDWSVNASRGVGPLTVSLSYLDSDARVLSRRGRNLADSTAVLGISLNY